MAEEGVTRGLQEIYQRFRQQILAGQLRPGDRVPAIRVLAGELQVARKTVEAAYEIPHRRRLFCQPGAKGTRVNPQLKLASAATPTRAPATTPALLPVTEGKGELRLGIPALDEFPHKKWRLLSAKAARSLRPDEMMIPPVMGCAAAGGHRQLPEYFARPQLPAGADFHHQRLPRQPAADSGGWRSRATKCCSKIPATSSASSC